MAAYEYRCPVHGPQLLDFPLGEAAEYVDCLECGLPADRVFTASLGYTYGRKEFAHPMTLRERQEQQIKEAESAGHDPVYVGNRWV